MAISGKQAYDEVVKHWLADMGIDTTDVSDVVLSIRADEVVTLQITRYPSAEDINILVAELSEGGILPVIEDTKDGMKPQTLRPFGERQKGN